MSYLILLFVATFFSHSSIALGKEPSLISRNDLHVMATCIDGMEGPSGKGKYFAVVNSGGSVWRSRFRFIENKIERYDVLEKMLDGIVCIEGSANVISRDTCRHGSAMTARLNSPLCIRHENNHARLVSPRHCTDFP
jgi:hypothetical protein